MTIVTIFSNYFRYRYIGIGTSVSVRRTVPITILSNEKMVTVKRHNRYRKKNGYRGKTQSVPKKTWLPWKNFHGTDFVFYGYRGLRFHGTDRVPIRYRYRLAYSLSSSEFAQIFKEYDYIVILAFFMVSRPYSLCEQ